MNFETALAMPATPPVDTLLRRRANQVHAEMLKLVDALCRSPLVPGTDSVH